MTLLEKGEIFLIAKEVHGLHTHEIGERTGCEQATIYNGIRLAKLPKSIKRYIISGKIQATTLLSLTRGIKNSLNYEKDLKVLIEQKIKDILSAEAAPSEE